MRKSSFVKKENDIILQSCVRCKNYKPLDASSYHRDKKEPRGFMTTCKQCRKEIQAAKPKKRKRYYKLDESERLIERECTDCRKIKSAHDFSNHSACPGGKYTVCRQCKSQQDREYANQNKEKVRANSRQYYIHNEEKIKKRVRSWAKENKEKCVDYDKKINRQAPIHKKFSRGIRELKQFIKCENKDAQTVLDKYCLDHIIPIKHDLVCGLNVPWNVQILKWSENTCKSNKFDGTYHNESWREDYLHLVITRSACE